MYSLAISNMLFRGDGKSRIFNADFFSNEADEILLSLEQNGIILMLEDGVFYRKFRDREYSLCYNTCM